MPIARRKCVRCQRNRAAKFYTPRGRICVTCRKAGRTKQTRALHLKRAWGLTVEQYDAMLASQNGGCAICGRKPVTKNLAVDHNHTTGEIRGLLCKQCNYRFLPVVEHHPERVIRARCYLEDPPSRGVL